MPDLLETKCAISVRAAADLCAQSPVTRVPTWSRKTSDSRMNRSTGAFSVAASTGTYAVFHRNDSGDRGDSIALFDAGGARTGAVIPAAV